MRTVVPKAIAAASLNRVIGKNGNLPWRLSEDLKWFKKITSGHAILMGRKTWESLGRPLPNRRNIALSRSMRAVDGMEVIRSLDEIERLDLELVETMVETEDFVLRRWIRKS